MHTLAIIEVSSHISIFYPFNPVRTDYLTFSLVAYGLSIALAWYFLCIDSFTYSL